MRNKDEIIEMLNKAHETVVALCKPKGQKGSREWIMSIPADPERDPDLIIGSAIREALKYIKSKPDIIDVYSPEDGVIAKVKA